MISAKIILDSISPDRIRLTTFSLRYPKFLHGEVMTHRVFSRNASSARAVPTKKFILEASDPALRAAPVWWGKNQAGMQAKEELNATDQVEAKLLWAEAASKAVEVAEKMATLGVHKQIVNRILEPFLHINTLVTSVMYDNWWGLRLHEDAQPEIQALANEMFDEYIASTPQLLKSGQWHLPYIEGYPKDQNNPRLLDYIKCSVARCARVSYTSFETGKVTTLEEDLLLYERLLGGSAIHASPAEHQATPDIKVYKDDWAFPSLHGNLFGWKQYRKMLAGEAVAPLPKAALEKLKCSRVS